MKLLVKILIFVLILLVLVFSSLIFIVIFSDGRVLLGPNEELNYSNDKSISENDSVSKGKAAKAGYENYSNLPQEEDFGDLNFSSLILGKAIFENLGGGAGFIIIIIVILLVFLFVKWLTKKKAVKK